MTQPSYAERTTEPDAEDILPLSELKSYLRIDTGDYDDTLAVAAAEGVNMAEHYLQTMLGSQGWTYYFSDVPAEFSEVPVTSLDSVHYLDGDAAYQESDVSNWDIVASNGVHTLQLAPGSTKPSPLLRDDAYKVVVTGGLLAASLPASVKLGVKYFARFIYEGQRESALMDLAKTILRPYRKVNA